jgi:hypothetical protein
LVKFLCLKWSKLVTFCLAGEKMEEKKGWVLLLLLLLLTYLAFVGYQMVTLDQYYVNCVREWSNDREGAFFFFFLLKNKIKRLDSRNWKVNWEKPILWFAFSVANAANFPFFSSCILVFGTFRYQLELCKKALEENIIVYLGTGCGKTHIAVLLIYEMGHLIRQPQKSACVFLAPTVALVHQVRFSCLKIFFLDLLFDFWMMYTFKINVAA